MEARVWGGEVWACYHRDNLCPAFQWRKGPVCVRIGVFACLRACVLGALGTRRHSVSVCVSEPNNGPDLGRLGSG